MRPTGKSVVANVGVPGRPVQCTDLTGLANDLHATRRDLTLASRESALPGSENSRVRRYELGESPVRRRSRFSRS